MSFAKANGSFPPFMGVTLYSYTSRTAPIFGCFFPCTKATCATNLYQNIQSACYTSLCWVVNCMLLVCTQQLCWCIGGLNYHEIVKWSHLRVHQWLVQMFDQVGWSTQMSHSIVHWSFQQWRMAWHWLSHQNQISSFEHYNWSNRSRNGGKPKFASSIQSVFSAVESVREVCFLPC